MTVEVKHIFQSPKGDGPDTSLVKPSDWNAAHQFQVLGPALVGRSEPGAGPVSEIPIGSGLAFQSGVLTNLLLPIPVGMVVSFAGSVEPGGWLFCFGQALSRVVYEELFAAIGTAYGVGDGATSFNLPDCRGRITAGRDNMGGTAANRIKETVDGKVLGSVIGSEKWVLSTNHLPSHTHTGTTGAGSAHSHKLIANETQNDNSPSLATDVTIAKANVFGGSQAYTLQNALPETLATLGNSSSESAHTHPFTTAATGAGEGHMNMQPTVITNTIIWTGLVI